MGRRRVMRCLIRSGYTHEDARKAATIGVYCRAVCVIFSGLPSAIAERLQRSAPTPSAKAPAHRKSLAVANEIPPVGIISTWGNGAFRLRRYGAPPMADAGNTLITPQPPYHP